MRSRNGYNIFVIIDLSSMCVLSMSHILSFYKTLIIVSAASYINSFGQSSWTYKLLVLYFPIQPGDQTRILEILVTYLSQILKMIPI